MANPEHLKILHQGEDTWNHWRIENQDIEPDLSNANLQDVGFGGTDLNLQDVNLAGANFADTRQTVSANFCGANLAGANLAETSIFKASFRYANLTGVKFSRARLIIVDFTGADLREADFREVEELGSIDFTGANLGYANFNKTRGCYGMLLVDTDLQEVIGLDTVSQIGPSHIGIDTLYKSHGKIPDKFLRDAGVPEEIITHIVPSIRNGPAIQWHSCFISYSTKDEKFARRLHSRMREANMRVWFAPEDLKGGKKLHEQLFEAIQIHDRLLIVLSEHSIQSEWVMTEIRKAREVEKKEKRRKLFPIRLCDMTRLQKWECFDADSSKDLAVEVHEYFIPDFSNWKDHDAFESAFARLKKDLEAENSKK